MFKFFKKKSEIDKLNEQYAKLMKESFILSSTDRKASDRKAAEAEDVANRIQEIRN
jgi:hypothetical protein